MSKTKESQGLRSLLALLLCFALLLSASTGLALPVNAAEDAPSTAFHYQHDPRLNPAAMADIVVDPTAVYGFAPSPDGSLKQYASYDWSDPAVVNGENGRLARIAYHESIQEMYTMLDEMTAQGKSVEEIARAVSTKRNEIRLAAYENDPEGLAAAKARNLERYGHEEGPLPDELYTEYGSWEVVIEKAFSVNSGMDACLGLYDDYYDLYVAAGQVADDRIAEYATREYVISEFVQSVGRKTLSKGDETLATFADSDEVGEDYVEDMSRAVNADIVRGYDDHTLRPQQNIRRIEALVILSRVLPNLDATRDVIEFTDVPAWAKDDIDRLSAAGIVNGYGDGILGADDNITVEQEGLLTDRSDDLLARVRPGESFFGYVNDKVFRNYDPDGPEINPYYGTVAEGSVDWSNFTQRTKDIEAQKNEVIQRLSDGKLTYEKGSAAQRLADLFDTLKYQDADREADTATFLRWQNLLLDAETPEAFLDAANTVLKESSSSVILSIGDSIDVDTGELYPIVQPNEVEQAAVIAYSADAQENYGDDYLNALTDYAAALGRGYTAADAETASDLQKQLHAGKDYYSLYSEMLSFAPLLGLLKEGVTDEEVNAVLDALKEQHPEFYNSEDIDTMPRPMATAEAAALNRDGSLNIVSLLENAGFRNFDYVLLESATVDVLKDVAITAENLNGWKINAAYELSRDLSFYPTTEEKAASDAISDCYANALYSGLVDIDAVHALSDSGGSNDDEELTLAGSLLTLMEKLPKDPSQLWCDYYYSDETTWEVLQMIVDIWMAYQTRFDNNTWMDETTRENAKKKLENMMTVLAYPDNYIYPEILSHAEGGTYLTNVCAIGKSALQEAIRECEDHEYARTIFVMDLDAVNASYLAQLNTISIYAGIMGGAFYDPDASYAHNLGAVGSVIGHEIGHAFDANGSQYDETGMKHDWWTAETAAKYEELKNRFVEYYADYEVVDGVVQDSTLTIGENMADFAGMTVIMDILEGDPEAQREALESYAATWVQISDVGNLTASRPTDPHSANQVRVNAVVASLDAFYELYDISEDDPMYVAPENRLQLW